MEQGCTCPIRLRIRICAIFSALMYYMSDPSAFRLENDMVRLISCCNSQSVVWRPPSVPKALSVGCSLQDYFHNNTRAL